MMAGGEHIGGTEGMSEARDAFESAMNAETPSKSKDTPDRKREEKTDIDELFPRRQLDRREREGGLDAGDPEVVKQARAEAKRRPTGEVEDHPPSEDDEPEDDEDEAELQEDEEEDEERPEEDEESAPPDGDLEKLLNTIVEVKIDGKPAEITLNEAVRGYIRTETFHQRLGELQNGVTELNSQRGEVSQMRQEYLERAKALEGYIQAFMPQEPNWDELYAADPTKAVLLERQWRNFQDKLGGLQGQRLQMEQEAEAEHNRHLHTFANTNRARLAQAHPEWKNEKTWKRDHDSMRRTARTAGYTDAEINQLYDARGVEVLLKASLYDRLMASKPKPVKQRFGTPTRPNGATPPQQRNVSRGFDRAEKRLSRSGSIKDAAGVFERMLDNER
jgi:hypothetical protein